MSKIIGIDLGTTNSCVAIAEGKEVTVIPNAQGSRTTPSVVSFGANDTKHVGVVAKRQAVTNPETTVFAVKRIMGLRFDSPEAIAHARSVPYKLVKSERGDAWVDVVQACMSPPEISAMILQHMRETAEAYLGESIDKAVVTVPAYFNDSQRAATTAAGKIAGLDIVRIINEPTAAALASGIGEQGTAKVAVYDLGGGTFDVSVLEISNGMFTVLGTAGDTHLGGEDIDNALVAKLIADFNAANGIDLSSDRVALQRVKEQSEKVKHELSTSLETEVNLPFIAAGPDGAVHLTATIRRTELEALARDLVERTLEPCRQALQDAKVTVKEIDHVLLVGGQTRMPLVQQTVSNFFGKAPHRGVNPDEVVAAGAAIQAQALGDDSQHSVLLLDVTPLSLGVETGGGIFTALIPRNTTVPTRATQLFTTSVDNQSFVPIHVLQGERQMAADNHSLAKFELAPILPAPRGVPAIEVSFDIDANGMVNVSAKDQGTGREQTIRVVASSGLSSSDIENIITRAEEFKSSDESRRDLAELKNAAAALVYTTSRAVDECRDLVSAEIITEVEGDLAHVEQQLEVGSIDSLRDAVDALELSAYKIADAMYGDLNA